MVFFQGKASLNCLNSSRGQATVEYLLLIVVVVAIASGIGRPLGKSLSAFSGAMVGPNGYYACLTEKGLLPGSDCNGQKTEATNKLLQPGQKTSLGGNVFNGDGNKSANSQAKKKKRSDGKSGKFRLSQKGGRASSKRSSNFQIDPFTAGSKKKVKKKRRNQTKKISTRETEESGGVIFTKNKKKHKKEKFLANRQIAYLGEEEEFIYQEEEERKPVFKAQEDIKKTKTGTKEETKKKQGFQKKRRDPSSVEEEENKGLDFSSFLKYLVIAMIILAILVVLFSQIMEYQNRE